MELIKKKAGVDIVHVPYQGGGPLTSAIVGGQVDVACHSIIAVIQLIKAGELRALAVSSEKRQQELPQVPTFGELGFSNASLPVRVGYMAPLGTPRAIIDRWNDAIQKALADPGVKSQMEKACMTIDYRPLEAMTKSMEELNRVLSDLIKEGALKLK